MGVIYKFKQEVVDFILQQKKDDPSLSCRRLTVIVQERFQVEVSKSSVNAVLKENSLSNSVGRQSKIKPPKNFFIPQGRKEALRAELAPLLPVVFDTPRPTEPETASAVPIGEATDRVNSGNEIVLAAGQHGSEGGADKTASVVQPEEGVMLKNEIVEASSIVSTVASPDLSPEIARVVEATDSSSDQGASVPAQGEEMLSSENQSLHLIPDLLSSHTTEEDFDHTVRKLLTEKKELKRSIWDEEGAVRLEQAQAVFLVAAFWEMDKERVLGNILAKALSTKGKGLSVDLVEGAVILMNLDKEVPEDIASTMALSVADLLGVDPAGLDDARRDVAWVLAADRQVALAFESALATISTQAACFELVAFSGRKIYVDLLWTRFSSEPIFPSDGGMPIFHAIERLAAEFVNNVEPLIISITGPGSLFSFDNQEVLSILLGLQDDYVDSVSVLTLRGDRIATFDLLPKICRGFILVGMLLEGDRSRVSFEEITDINNYFNVLTGIELGYYNGTVDFGSKKALQSFIFFYDKNGNKQVVLTNLQGLWVGFESCFLVNELMTEEDGGSLYNKIFYKKIKNLDLNIKILNSDVKSLNYIKNKVSVLNRKCIINGSGQRLWVTFANEF